MFDYFFTQFEQNDGFQSDLDISMMMMKTVLKGPDAKAASLFSADSLS
jgi:hypothetical protein